MKNLLLIALIVLSGAIGAFAQADKPSMMIFPENIWMNQHGFAKQVQLNGRTKLIPNYEDAYNNNTEVGEATAALNELFQQKGFEMTSLQESLGQMDEFAAEELTAEADGYSEETNMDPTDQLLDQVKPDIKLTLSWEIAPLGFNKTMRVSVKAYDSYTNKQIGTLTSTTPPMPKSTFTSNMLQQAVNQGFDGLCNGLMTYFMGLKNKGREIKMRVLVTKNSSVTLFDQVGGDRLNMVLQKWVRQHSKNGTGTVAGAAARNLMTFQGIRIPLTDDSGMKITAAEWAANEGLEAYLKSLGISARVDSRGMGLLLLRIGAQ